MAYIQFQGICKNYGSNHVLKDIDLQIEKGQLVTLLGPSGCGKSTLLRCLAGLETVSSGDIFLDGKNITNVNPKDRDIGMVFQQYSLFPNMNVEQNVAFGLKMKKAPKDYIQKKVGEILEVVGLSDKNKHYPSQLSGGQQQRAALARAIITEPKVLLLDEPLSAIDALLRHSLQVEIRRIQKELDITAVFVTHDQDEAMVMSDVIGPRHSSCLYIIPPKSCNENNVALKKRTFSSYLTSIISWGLLIPSTHCSYSGNTSSAKAACSPM